MQLRALILRSVTLGTFAALAMMPFGFAFRMAGMRVRHLPIIVPSLMVHTVFGLAVAYADRGGFGRRRTFTSV